MWDFALIWWFASVVGYIARDYEILEVITAPAYTYSDTVFLTNCVNKM